MAMVNGTVEFTDEEIKGFKDGGRDFAGDWHSWQKDKKKALDEFDGQSEAMDMAMSELEGVEAECAASYIYDGMREMIEGIKKENAGGVLGTAPSSRNTVGGV